MIVLLLNIVHEMGHLAIITYQNFDSIIEEELTKPIFSVIRKTNRPAILAFHAMVATIYMLEFLIDLKRSNITISTNKNYIHKRSQELIKSLQIALKHFRTTHFSILGNEIYSEARSVLALSKLVLC